jgi:hypothetical protein
MRQGHVDEITSKSFCTSSEHISGASWPSKSDGICFVCLASKRASRATKVFATRTSHSRGASLAGQAVHRDKRQVQMGSFCVNRNRASIRVSHHGCSPDWRSQLFCTQLKRNGTCTRCEAAFRKWRDRPASEASNVVYTHAVVNPHHCGGSARITFESHSHIHGLTSETLYFHLLQFEADPLLSPLRRQPLSGLSIFSESRSRQPQTKSN